MSAAVILWLWPSAWWLVFAAAAVFAGLYSLAKRPVSTAA
jgi:hypothetical protein